MTEKQFVRACAKGDIERVKTGLDAGISADSTDQYGLSALILAARKGQIETAKMLIEAGADINFPDVTKRTPLFHAVCFEKLEMISLLADHGANLDVIDMQGCTPCKLAEYGAEHKTIDLLRSLGATTCSAENKFLQINIGLDGIQAKGENSFDLARSWIQKIREEISEIEIEKLKEELEVVCVVLAVGVDLPVQPVDFEDCGVGTLVGIPDSDSDDQMRACVFSALLEGYLAIADYLESHFGDSIDFEKFRFEIKSVFKRVLE